MSIHHCIRNRKVRTKFKQLTDDEAVAWEQWEGHALTVYRENLSDIILNDLTLRYQSKHLTTAAIRNWLYEIGIQPGSYLMYRHKDSWRERLEFRFEDPTSISFIKMSIGSELKTIKTDKTYSYL